MRIATGSTQLLHGWLRQDGWKTPDAGHTVSINHLPVTHTCHLNTLSSAVSLWQPMTQNHSGGSWSVHKPIQGQMIYAQAHIGSTRPTHKPTQVALSPCTSLSSQAAGGTWPIHKSTQVACNPYASQLRWHWIHAPAHTGETRSPH